MQFVKLTFQTEFELFRHGAPPQETLEFAVPYHAIKYLKKNQDDDNYEVIIHEEYMPEIPDSFDLKYTNIKLSKKDITLLGE